VSPVAPGRKAHVGGLGVDRPALGALPAIAAPRRCPPEIHTKVRRRSAIPPSFRSLRSLHVAEMLHVAHLRIDFLRCPTGPHRYSCSRSWAGRFDVNAAALCDFCHWLGTPPMRRAELQSFAARQG